MQRINFIDGIEDIAQGYDAMACDAWGVIHNGRALSPGVSEALISFREKRGPVVIVTNAPKPSSLIPAQLDRIGLPRGAWDAIVTSGDATREEIRARLPAPAFAIGPAHDDALYEGLGVAFAPLEKAGFIVCTGLDEEIGSEPEDYRALLSDAAARDLPMVCANPDIVVNWRGKLAWCAGAIAEVYESLGGSVSYGGKPHPPIYRLVRAAIDAAAGAPVDEGRILAVGDGLGTDIRGANKAGLDALLITGADGILDHDPASLARALTNERVSIVAAAERLVW